MRRGCRLGRDHKAAISMYKVSVPIFVQLLTALSGAAAHAEAKQLDPAFLLNMRLYPDMYPLVRQVQQATNHAMRACSALAGAEPLNLPNTETSFPSSRPASPRPSITSRASSPPRSTAPRTRTSRSPTSANSAGRNCCSTTSSNDPVGRGRSPQQLEVHPRAPSPPAPTAIREKEISPGSGGSSILLLSSPRAAAAAPRQRIQSTPETRRLQRSASSRIRNSPKRNRRARRRRSGGSCFRARVGAARRVNGACRSCQASL